MSRHIGSGICAVLLMAACGGESGPADGQPLTGDALTSACQETCEHMVACAWATDATACAGACSAQSGFFRGSGYADWMACMAAAPCMPQSPGEGCYVSTAAGTDPREVHNDYVAMCQAVPTTCPVITLPADVCDLDQVILFSD